MKCLDLKTLSVKLTGPDLYERLTDLEPRVRAVASLWYRQGLGTMAELLRDAWAMGKRCNFVVEVSPLDVSMDPGHRHSFDRGKERRFNLADYYCNHIGPTWHLSNFTGFANFPRLRTVAEYRSRPIALVIVRSNPRITRTIRKEA